MKKPIVIVIIILVVVNLVIFGYVLTRDASTDVGSTAVDSDFVTLDELLNTNASTNTNVTVTNTNTTTATNQNTNTSAGTTTIVSSGIDASVDLPAGYTLSQYSDLTSEIVQIVNYDEASLVPMGGAPPGIKVEISVLDNEESLDLLEWIFANTLPDDPEITYAPTEVAGDEAFYEETITTVSGSRSIYVLRDDRIYIIYVIGERDAYENESDTINAIIDSITWR